MESEKNNIKKIKKALVVGLVLVFATAVLGLLIYYLWTKGAFIPSYATWHNREDTYVIGDEAVEFSLKKKTLKIFDNKTKELIYETPDEWKVSDCFYFDIDHDDENEVVMVVWKQGSFGEHKPFWHEGKDNKWTQHIFIYDWDITRDNRLRAIWMSSGLGIKASEIFTDEKDRLHLIDDKGEETVWQWISWGLTLMEVIPVE
ncbi:MAG: hypothetical protein IJ053_00340 [Lachnospiraceae bacterium]|nr:hypothetical protein [Lachnospiraceae bacterium]